LIQFDRNAIDDVWKPCGHAHSRKRGYRRRLQFRRAHSLHRIGLQTTGASYFIEAYQKKWGFARKTGGQKGD
jgi:hypothetical protein